MKTALLDDLNNLDPTDDDLDATIALLVQIETVAALQRARLVRRAGELRHHLAAGYKRLADWGAHLAGTSVGQARSEQELLDQLDTLPLVAEALSSGRLSMAKAREVAAGATAHPASEQALLDRARHATWHDTREAAQRVEANSAPNGGEDRLAHHKDKTKLKHWIGRDGMGHVTVQWAADDHTGFLQALAGQREHVFDQARAAEEEQVPLEQLDARALVRVAGVAAGASNEPVKAKHQILVTVDLAAWLTGQATPDQTCQIGTMTVPVSLAKAMAHESQLALGFWDGVDVSSIYRVGRYKNPDLDAAVTIRDGKRCVVETCRQWVWTERDHHEEVHDGGATSYEQLRDLCRWHHKLKTLGFITVDRDPITRRWAMTVLHTPSARMAA